MSTPENVSHPRVDIADRYGSDVFDTLSAAIAESPSGIIEVHYGGAVEGELTALDATGCLTTWNVGA